MDKFFTGRTPKNDIDSYRQHQRYLAALERVYLYSEADEQLSKISRAGRLGRILLKPWKVMKQTIQDGNEATELLPGLRAMQKFEDGEPLSVEEVAILADEGVSVSVNPLRPTN